jgi:hypothetical protein
MANIAIVVGDVDIRVLDYFFNLHTIMSLLCLSYLSLSIYWVFPVL